MYTLDIRCRRTRVRTDSERHTAVPDTFPLHYKQETQNTRITASVSTMMGCSCSFRSSQEASAQFVNFFCWEEATSTRCEYLGKVHTHSPRLNVVFINCMLLLPRDCI